MARRVVAQEVITYEAETEKMVKALERARKKVEQLEQTVRDRGKAMATESDNNVATMIVSFNKVSFGVTRVINRVRRISEAFRFVGRVLITSWVRPMTDATKAAADFSLTMAGVSTVMPKVGASIQDLREHIFDMSASLGKTAQESGKTLFTIFQAGVTETAGAVDLLTAANKLSVAGFVDANTAVDGMTSVLHAYGASMSEAGTVSDIMFAAARLGKTSIEELNQSIGYVAGSAADAGINFSEVAAALAVMTNAGVQTDKAAIGLNQILTALRKVTPQAAAEAKRLGIEFNLAAVRSKGLANFILEIASNSKLTDQSLGRLFGNVRALRAFFGLARENGEAFREILEGIAGSGGESEEALLKVNEALGQYFKQLDASKETAKISFGEQFAHVFKLKDAIKELTRSFDDLGRRARLGDFNDDIEALGIVAGGLTLTLTGLAAVIGVTVAALGAMLHAVTPAALGIDSFTESVIRLGTRADDAHQSLIRLASQMRHGTFAVKEDVAFEALSSGLADALDIIEGLTGSIVTIDERGNEALDGYLTLADAIAMASGKVVSEDARGNKILVEKAQLLREQDERISNILVRAKALGLSWDEIVKKAQALRGVSKDIQAPPGGLPTEPPKEKGPRINIGDLLKRVDTMFEQLERKTQEGLDKIAQISLRVEKITVTEARRLFNERLGLLQSEIRQTQELLAQRTAIRASLEKRLNEAIAGKSKERVDLLKQEIESMDNAIDQEREQLQRRIQQVVDAQKKLENAKAASLKLARDLIGGVDSKQAGARGIVEEHQLLRRARKRFVAQEQDPEARKAGLQLFDEKQAEIHAKAAEIMRQANEQLRDSFIQLASSITEDMAAAFFDLATGATTTADFFKQMAKIAINALQQMVEALIRAQAEQAVIAKANILASASEGAARAGKDAGAAAGPAALAVIPIVSSLVFGILAAFATRFAAGGPVTGGIRGQDSVLAMLMPGEFVLDARTVENIKRGRSPAMFAATAGTVQAEGGSGGGGWNGDFVFAPTIRADAMPGTEENLSMLKKGIMPAVSELAHRGVRIEDPRSKGRRGRW